MLVCIPDVLSPSQVKHVRDWMDAADFVDGKTTAGFRAKRVKKNEQVGRNLPERSDIDKIVLDGLKASREFNRVVMPRKIQRPLLSRYKVGMEYGLHVDDALMGAEGEFRTDVSVTVFLNQPYDYEGGELEIHSPFGIEGHKAPAGSAIVYPSSTLHRVTPVTKGERLAAVTWVQSKIRDPFQREILHDLDLIRRKLADSHKDAEETDLAFKIYANLQRVWLDS